MRIPKQELGRINKSLRKNNARIKGLVKKFNDLNEKRDRIYDFLKNESEEISATFKRIINRYRSENLRNRTDKTTPIAFRQIPQAKDFASLNPKEVIDYTTIVKNKYARPRNLSYSENNLPPKEENTFVFASDVEQM